jgi:F-type H+-transporting ATPase subunit epsilon
MVTTDSKSAALHLRVVTPDRTVVDRKVKAVTFMGVDGSYGILPRHAALMTATKPGIVKITHLDDSVERMLVTEGFAEVRDNVLTLLCEAGELAHEVDVERAKEAEARARQQLADIDKVKGDLPRAEAESALRRAMLRQLLAGGRQGGPTSGGNY